MDEPGPADGPRMEDVVNGMTKLRVCLVGLGFGVALLIAPAAHAQAESSPDHFTETGVEIGPGGSVTQSSSHVTASKRAQKTQKAAQAEASAKSSAAHVTVAAAVADRNRRLTPAEPKR